MQPDDGYDTTRFEALRRVLSTLNEGALADGLVAVRDGVAVVPEPPRRALRKAAKATAAAKATPKAPEGASPTAEKKPDRSPAAAARLLALLRRQEGDESADLSGTTYTEAGVARLLAHLRARRSKRGGGAWARFLQRADRYLARPVPLGIRTVRGVGFERLQVVARQLAEIEANGWARFRESRAVRRRKVVPAPPLIQDAGPAKPPAKPSARSLRKGTSL